MTQKRAFGHPDPLQDKRRVLTAIAVGNGAPPVAGEGGALENKIYLWPADGGAISTFDPDEAGLIVALAAAVSGDTVRRPSIEIALTAAISIPAGVIDYPISDGAILSFSGFGGAAITLGTGSRMYFPVVRFTATGSDAIGIEAGAEDCLVYEPDIEVSGGTVTNHAINGGHTPTANEFWQMVLRTGFGHSIAWTTTLDFTDTINDTTWHAIESWPAGFDSPITAGVFAMRQDGSELYIGAGSSIWRCTNVAAIRAAPATAPTWSAILDSSSNIGGYNPLALQNLAWWNDRLVCMMRTTQTTSYYGEYLGGSWTWYAQGFDSSVDLPITYRVAGIASGGAIDAMHVYNPATLATYFDKSCGFGAGNYQPIWRNFDPLNSDFITAWKAAAATTKIVGTSGTVLHDTGLTVKNAVGVSGANLGAQLYVVMEDGESFVSEDGATFAQQATWQAGRLLDATEVGGGGLAWVRNITPDNGEALHISLDRGATTIDKTGDLFSVLSSSAGGLTICGAALVY